MPAAAVGVRIEVHLLGPVEVVRNGSPVRLGGPRQRALLAVLALHANEVVSVDRLVVALFGVDAAESAVNAVQVAVSRLRRLLDDGMLETQAGGYLLRLDHDQLDAARFERLLADGRSLLRSGDPAAAGAALRGALELFRGPPLADLGELEFAAPEIRRLEELHLAALMERIEADLAAGEGSGVVAELEALVASNPLQERLRGQLMLALYRSGRQADALTVYRQTRELLSDELGLEPGRELQQLERAILTQDSTLDVRPAATIEVDTVEICPFKGLASFESADTEFFCGRERVVEELVSRLADASLVGIIGPSGIGKSSILRAGLIPRLAAGALPGSAHWRTVLVRPGAQPTDELIALLSESRDAEERLILAVDQLEEVFTACADEQERTDFFQTLADAALDPGRTTVVAVSLRADFYGRCAAYPAFARLLSRNHVLVGPMQRDELTRAVTIPSTRAGLELEEGLVAALIADIGEEPGGLPLLSTTLLELWRRRNGRTLRLSDYRENGGVHGAVGRLAETAYGQLSTSQRETARSLMLRLAAGEPGAVVRRRVAAADLTRGDTTAVHVLDVLVAERLLTVDDGAVEVAHEALLREWPRMRQWLEEERDARRLHADLGAAARAWDDRGRDAADLQRGARLAATLDWAAGHDGELDEREQTFLEASRAQSERELLAQKRRNRRLKGLVVAIATLLVVALAAGAVALAQRGHARHEATVALARQLGAQALTEPRIDRSMLLAREALNLGTSTQTQGTLLATLLRSPAAIATFASPITSRPQRLSVSPDGRTLAVSDNNAAVRFYDLASRRLRGILEQVAFGTPVAYTPNASLFVVPARAGTDFEVRDTRTLRVVRRLHPDRQFLTRQTNAGTTALIDRNGIVFFAYNLVRANGSNGAAYLDRWNLASGRRITTAMPLEADGALDLRSLDDGRRLLVVGDRVITVLGAERLQRIARFHVPFDLANTYGSDAVSPDGRTLVVGSNRGTVSFLDVHTGAVRAGLESHSAAVQSAAFAHDGRTVATTSSDGSVIIWNVASAAPIEQLLGHAGRVLGVAFSPNDQTLYTCSLDGAIFEWDLGTQRRFGQPFATIPSHNTPSLGSDESEIPPPLALSPNGSRFAVRVGRTEVGLFSTKTTERIGAFRARVGDIAGLAWSSLGMLAVTGDGGRVQLWRGGREPRVVRSLRGMGSVNKEPETVTTVAFSPSGRFVAAGDVNHTPYNVNWRYGTIAVWNAASGRLLWRIRKKTGWVTDVSFSPDGKTIAAASESGTVLLYDVATAKLERTLRPEGSGGFTYLSDAFASDGTLATGTWAGILQRWSRRGTELGHPALVSSAPVSTISFTPDSSTVATAGGSDGLAKLWTTSTLQQLGANLPGSTQGSGWGSAEYTPDGRKLVVVFEDGTGSVWPTSVAAWERHACAVANRNFTREEWRRYVGARPYATICPSQPSVSER